MDILTQLAGVKDVQLQTLLSHAMRNVLHHNMIAANAEANQAEDPQARAQQQVGVALHRETAMIITELTNQLLKTTEAVKPPAAGKAKKK